MNRVQCHFCRESFDFGNAFLLHYIQCERDSKSSRQTERRQPIERGSPVPTHKIVNAIIRADEMFHSLESYASFMPYYGRNIDGLISCLSLEESTRLDSSSDSIDGCPDETTEEEDEFAKNYHDEMLKQHASASLEFFTRMQHESKA